MLTKELAEEAVEILANEGHEASVYENYSGRGMYGSTCVGIVTSASGVLVGWAISYAYMLQCSADNDGEENDIDYDMIKVIKILPTRSDSMGCDTIYY